MEPPEIERLDERTIQRIAAGEVVERPASVVKELIENSLDAGATRIAVSVEADGTEGIRVRDDGVGIPADQLEAAVAEHATSKIGDIEDLDAGVATLGFRGEALYTVGGVSRLTVRSKPPGTDAGAEITVEGGSIGEVRPAGCPTGTVVEVGDLFYNTPARKKFLNRVATEFDHVNTVVTSYALANPDVAVSLEHDGRETFATEGNGDLRSAVLAVYGREVAESMIDVDWTPGSAGGDAGAAVDGEATIDGDDEDPPVIRVTGLVSHPETTRASRDYLGTYVNGRYVTASVLREAVLDAYGGQLAPDRYPFTVLFVEVPPDDVDVNVHPRKLEVRFDESTAVRSAVADAVESALLDHGLIRSTAPRGESAPDEVAVDPGSADTEVVGGADVGGGGVDGRRVGDPGRDNGADGNTGGSNGDADGAEATTSRDIEPDPGTATELAPDDEEAWAVDDLGGGDDAADGTTDAPMDVPTDAEAGDADPTAIDPTVDDAAVDDAAVDDAETDDAATDDAATDDTEAADRPSPRDWQSSPGDGPEPSASGDSPGMTAGDSPVTPAPDAGFEGDPASEPRFASDTDAGSRADNAGSRTSPPMSQRTLTGGETAAERTYDSLPPLRVLGQLHETYVVAEAPDGLVLIDQHAADERVHYERLQREFADGATAQALAEPVRIDVTAREAALFDEFVDDLATIGFRAERAGDREVVVEAVPAVFDAALDPTLVREVLSALVGDASEGDEPVTDVVDELLADLACYPSVTGNTSLTEGHVVDLLERLDDCENPYACPHGRPVVIRMDHDEIGSRFERDYPGHAGRRAE